MPEGDTVWRAARQLDAALAGHDIVRTVFQVPELATATLTGRRMVEVVARGKHILMRTQPGEGRRGEALTLHSHLRMDGRWRILDASVAGYGCPAHHVRAVLATDTKTVVGDRVRDLWLVRTEDEHQLVGHLGPDLLDDTASLEPAVRLLDQRPERMIGPALLDQRNLAGIGNLYKCEVLFLRGVSPWTPVGAVPDLLGMVTLARRLLRANRGRSQQATTGDLRTGRRTWVYERHKKPCRRCATPIRRAEQHEDGHGLSGDPRWRSTYWCPSCQQGPGPTS